MREVVFARQFWASIEAMDAYYRIRRLHHPDAGRRLIQFIDALETEILPKIKLNPDLGRRHQVVVSERGRVLEELARIAPIQTRRALVIREWLWGDFAIQYAYSATHLVITSAKHQRQNGYS